MQYDDFEDSDGVTSEGKGLFFLCILDCSDALISPAYCFMVVFPLQWKGQRIEDAVGYKTVIHLIFCSTFMYHCSIQIVLWYVKIFISTFAV